MVEHGLDIHSVNLPLKVKLGKRAITGNRYQSASDDFRHNQKAYCDCGNYD